jgi:tetratricopeptide (TPR) repeat protein
MRAKSMCTAVLLLAFSFAHAAHAQTQTPSEEARARGYTALREHRYTDAIHLLELALKNSPNDRGLKIELGKAYLYNHQDDRAIQLFKEVLREDPSNRPAKLELARALGYQRNYEASDALYRELLKANADEEAETGLIRNLMHQGKWEEASRELKIALARYPNSPRLREYERRLERKSHDGKVRQRSTRPEPKPAAWETQRKVIGTVAYLSDSAGNRSLRSSQEFDYAFTPRFSTKAQVEQRSLWLTPGPKANLLWGTGELQWHLTQSVTVTGGAGLVRFADTSSRGLYRGGLEFHPTRNLWISGGFNRTPIAPTFFATQFDLLANEWNARLAWNPRGWRTSVYLLKQHYSDTNDARRAGVELIRWLGTSRFSVGAGYQFRYIAFDQALLHGYFEPSRYQSHLGVGGIKYGIGRRFRGEYLGRIGGETIAGAPYQTAWEVALRHRVVLEHWDLGADYSYFRLAQSTGAYRAQMGRFSVAYRF